MSPRLEHANLCVRDIDAMIRFLQTAMPEFRVRADHKDSEGSRWVHLGTDDSYIALSRARAEPLQMWQPYMGFPGMNHLGYEVDDAAALRTRMLAAGFEESTVPNKHPHRNRQDQPDSAFRQRGECGPAWALVGDGRCHDYRYPPQCPWNRNVAGLSRRNNRSLPGRRPLSPDKERLHGSFRGNHRNRIDRSRGERSPGCSLPAGKEDGAGGINHSFLGEHHPWVSPGCGGPEDSGAGRIRRIKVMMKSDPQVRLVARPVWSSKKPCGGTFERLSPGIEHISGLCCYSVVLASLTFGDRHSGVRGGPRIHLPQTARRYRSDALHAAIPWLRRAVRRRPLRDRGCR